MKLHELWRAQYRARRYIQHLSSEELQQRAKDIVLNLTVITEEAKLGLPPMNDEGKYWMTQWTHVLEEFKLRFGPYPNGFRDGHMRDLVIPRPDVPLAALAAKAVKSREIIRNGYLVKYGKAKYLRDAFEKGSIRVAPAESYSDSSLNYAIGDKELEFTIQPSPSEIRMEVVDPMTGRTKGSISPLGNKITVTSPTNYYVYCLSTIFAPRLFLDFDHADACLIITKPQAFIERLTKAFDIAVPGFDAVAKPVKYIVPLNVRIEEIEIYFGKHFR